MIFWGEILFTQGAVSQVLDSLEEMQCLTDCTGEEKDLIEKVFQDTKLHALLLVSLCTNKLQSVQWSQGVLNKCISTSLQAVDVSSQTNLY